MASQRVISTICLGTRGRLGLRRNQCHVVVHNGLVVGPRGFDPEPSVAAVLGRVLHGAAGSSRV